MPRLPKRTKRWWKTLRETVRLFGTNRAPRLAAAISYFTAFALAPLLIVVVAVAGLVLDPAEVQARLLDESRDLVGSQGARLLGRLMEQTADTRASIIGLVVGLGATLLGASGAVLALKDAVNTIFGVQPKPVKFMLGTVIQRAIAIVAVIALGVVLVAALLVSAAIVGAAAWIGRELGISTELVTLTNQLLTLAIITLLVAAAYKLLADVRIRWRQTLPGALVTAVLILLGQSLIGTYLAQRDVPATYGAASSLAIILIWIFLNSMIVLFGAAFVRAYMEVYRGGIRPGKLATRVRYVEVEASDG